MRVSATCLQLRSHSASFCSVYRTLLMINTLGWCQDIWQFRVRRLATAITFSHLFSLSASPSEFEVKQRLSYVGMCAASVVLLLLLCSFGLPWGCSLRQQRCCILMPRHGNEGLGLSYSSGASLPAREHKHHLRGGQVDHNVWNLTHTQEKCTFLPVFHSRCVNAKKGTAF